MNIYEMKLHDSFWDSGIGKSITRVPGGWLYGDWDTERDQPIEGATFVPFNNEFMECSEKGEPSFNSPASPAQQAEDVICPRCHRQQDRTALNGYTQCQSCGHMW